MWKVVHWLDPLSMRKDMRDNNWLFKKVVL